MREYIYKWLGIHTDHSTTDELRVKVNGEALTHKVTSKNELDALDKLVKDTLIALNNPSRPDAKKPPIE